MKLDYKGDEVPAYIDITFNDVNFLCKEVFNRTYIFPKRISCITLDVKPYYCKNPKTLEECLNELCLRGKIKRGSYIIENA